MLENRHVPTQEETRFIQPTQPPAAEPRAGQEKEPPFNPFFILLAGIGLLIVVLLFASHVKADRTVRKRSGMKRTPKVPCPLCGSRLFEGERIRSVAYDLGQEKLMHIYGCPYCERPGSGIRRRCPVCRREIPLDGFVVGRMWSKIDKTHLHITGCTECKPQYKTSATGQPGTNS